MHYFFHGQIISLPHILLCGDESRGEAPHHYEERGVKGEVSNKAARLAARIPGKKKGARLDRALV